MEDPVHLENLNQWYKADKEKCLRFEYPLNSNSIVFDLGAFTGDWALEIYKRYNCTIHSFEPVQNIFNELCTKTKDIKSIILHNYAVSNQNGIKKIFINKDGSGFHIITNETEEVKTKSIVNIINELNINNIDMMKFNVEAEEYVILEKMIENDLLKIVDIFQIQFHRDVDNYKIRREFIQNKLSKTHELIYNFDFIWESWKRK